MHCKNHTCIAFPLLIKIAYTFIKHVLSGLTLDLRKQDFASGSIVGFDVYICACAASPRQPQPASSIEDLFDELFEIFRLHFFD